MDENYLVKKSKKEEEKRKKRGLLYLLGIKNRRLFLLIIAFIFTIVILSTSTYAWFTSNYTVTVQPIDVQVSSGSGIQISTDAVNWKSMITLADIQAGYTGGVNKVPTAEMSPVSTVKAAYADATTYSQGLKMYKGTIVNDVHSGVMYLDSVQELDTSTTEKNYIAFDLFLKMDFKATEQVQTQQVYFTSSTGIDTYGNANTYIEYAGRMGFVVQGTQPSSTAVDTLRHLKGATSVTIYEPNYDVHTANGLINGAANYGITGFTPSGATQETPYTQADNAQAVPYYGVKAAFEYDDTEDPTAQGYTPSGTRLNSTDENKFALVTPDYQTTANNTSTFPFMSLGPGVTKIRVYMWIEGQDIDCENTASGGNVEFSLGFTLEPTATPTATPEP